MHSCGTLLHISSLPSRYGIGTLGKSAYNFIDFLNKSGQKYWQILPIGPTGYGDSPYQCYSAYAGNPLLIDLEKLIEEKLISEYDPDIKFLNKANGFDSYSKLFNIKNVVLHKACETFLSTDNKKKLNTYITFCNKNVDWLDNYALFMSLKYHFNQVMWLEWPDDIRLRKGEAIAEYSKTLEKEIEYWKFTQFKFFEQYNALKNYANENNILLFGDMPIYVSADSADIWADPKLFMLDDNLKPIKVAGCPPDDYSPTGQLWGNPVYNWDAMKVDGYKWWINRVAYSQKLFDLIRIDHFRGFESYYSIPAKDKTAENGEWVKGPGYELFEAIKKELGDVNLVAEDLGFLTDSVKKMLKRTGFPGMKVLEFAFYDKDSTYLPHNYIQNTVAYIGTHDNDTTIGWYKTLDKKTKKFAKQYCRLSKSEGINWGLIRTLYSSVSDLVIVQMQDFLGLDSKSRMNTPSTVGNGNWMWRMKESDMSLSLIKKIKKLAKLYSRSNPKKKAVSEEITETAEDLYK